MERTVDLENVCHMHNRNFSQYSQRMAMLWLDIPVYLINFVCRVQSLSVMCGEKRVELCRDTRPITSVIRDHNIRRQLHDTTRTSKKVWLAKQQLCTCKELFGTFLCRHCTTSTWSYLISGFMEDVTLGAKNFSSAVSGFCQVFTVTRARLRRSWLVMCRPSANTENSRRTRERLLVPRVGGRNKASTKFSFSIWFWILFLGTQLQESSPTCDKASELKQEIIIPWSLGWNSSDEDWKNANSIHKRDVFPAVDVPRSKGHLRD